MLTFENINFSGRRALAARGIGEYDLRDTMECGQCFRYERLPGTEGLCEYMTVVRGKIFDVGQRERGELLFFMEDTPEIRAALTDYFALDVDFEAIRRNVIEHTDSAWLRRAADEARGIAILRQEPWEALFSFIISQNNNIPRIRKIIRMLSAAYGERAALPGGSCPIGRACDRTAQCVTPCTEKDPAKCGAEQGDDTCRACGICYTFPTAEQIVASPGLMEPAHTGFRYAYLLDAATRVASGECNLAGIAAAGSYETTLTELKRIKGVGDKVASCVALFGMGNYDAFPIDVWMKRAIDEYFGGHLDPRTLGPYAGVAQQYIFHYIRNLEREKA